MTLINVIYIILGYLLVILVYITFIYKHNKLAFITCINVMKRV